MSSSSYSPTVRRRRPSHRQIALAVSGFAFVLLAPGLFWGPPEGKAIVGGLRVLAGDVPYRDFWTMYAPGQFYLVAGLFQIFGGHVLVQGVAVLLIIAAAAGILLMILRDRLEIPIAGALPIVAVFVGMQWGLSPEMSSYQPLLLCGLLAIGRLLRYFQGEGRKHLVWAGAWLGVGAWFKHDVAFYLVAGASAAFVVSWRVAARNRPTGWISPVRAVGTIALISGAVVLPVFALVAWAAGPDAWEDLVRFPASDFSIVRGEEYPPLVPPWRTVRQLANGLSDPLGAAQALAAISTWIQGNVPQAVFPAGLIWLFLQRRRLPPSKMAAALLFLWSMPLFWVAAHVQQNTHFYSMSLMTFLFGAVAWTSTAAGATGRPFRTLIGVVFVLYAVGLLIRPAVDAATVVYQWPGSRTTDIPFIRGIRLPERSHSVYEPILRFVREHVPPEEPIYAGVTRHDAIVISNPAFYYLAERPSATRFDELHPGFADRSDYQQEIIDDLERQGVRCVILWRFGWNDDMLDAIKAARRSKLPELGATRLDEYFSREFEPLAQYGEYLLMWRRGSPRPTGW